MEITIVDTDIAIDYLRGLPAAKDFLKNLWMDDSAFLSVLSVYELYAGMKDNEKTATDHFIKACFIEPVVPEIAATGGQLYRHYRRQGITLTVTDCLIYATAKIRNYKIATRNVKHYPDGNVVIPF